MAEAEREAARLRFCDIVENEDEKLEPFHKAVDKARERLVETKPTTLLGLKRLLDWHATLDPGTDDFVDTTVPRTILVAVTDMVKRLK